jgi:hypothetical protein
MIVRWIWSVPPAMEMAGTDRKISAIIPSSGEPGPASMPCGPAICACTRAAWRAMTLLASLPSEPSGPGGRPARCGYHLCGSLAAVRSAVAAPVDQTFCPVTCHPPAAASARVVSPARPTPTPSAGPGTPAPASSCVTSAARPAGSDRPHQPRGQAGHAHPVSASNSRHRARLSSGSQLASIHRRSSASTPVASGTGIDVDDTEFGAPGCRLTGGWRTSRPRGRGQAGRRGRAASAATPLPAWPGCTPWASIPRAGGSP